MNRWSPFAACLFIAKAGIRSIHALILLHQRCIPVLFYSFIHFLFSSFMRIENNNNNRIVNRILYYNKLYKRLVKKKININNKIICVYDEKKIQRRKNVLKLFYLLDILNAQKVLIKVRVHFYILSTALFICPFHINSYLFISHGGYSLLKYVL